MTLRELLGWARGAIDTSLKYFMSFNVAMINGHIDAFKGIGYPKSSNFSIILYCA